MDFLKELTKSVKPGHVESMEQGEFFDRGDGIMEMMLKPALATYESKDDKSKKSADEDDDWIHGLVMDIITDHISISINAGGVVIHIWKHVQVLFILGVF